MAERETEDGIMTKESKKESSVKTGIYLVIIAIAVILLVSWMFTGGGASTQANISAVTVKNTTQQVPKAKQKQAQRPVVKAVKAPSKIGKVKIRNFFEEARKEILSKSEWGSFGLTWASAVGGIRDRIKSGSYVSVGRIYDQIEANSKYLEMSAEMTILAKLLVYSVLEVNEIVPENITPAVRNIKIEGVELQQIVNEMDIILDVYMEFYDAWYGDK